MDELPRFQGGTRGYLMVSSVPVYIGSTNDLVGILGCTENNFAPFLKIGDILNEHIDYTIIIIVQQFYLTANVPFLNKLAHKIDFFLIRASRALSRLRGPLPALPSQLQMHVTAV